MTNLRKVEIEIPGREQLCLEVNVEAGNNVALVALTGIGDVDFLKQLKNWRPKMNGPLQSLEVPEGNSPGSMILREAILKVKEEWHPPYQKEQICHCRAIRTSKVDLAIVLGAHTMAKIRRDTSANTACGTCQGDIESMLRYRLK